MPLYIKTGSIRDAAQINAAVDAGFAATIPAYLDLVGRLVPERVPRRTGKLQNAIIEAAQRSTEENLVFSARGAKDSNGRSYIGFVDRIHGFWRPLKHALKSRVGKVFRDVLRAHGLEVSDSKRGAGLLPSTMVPEVIT